MCVCVRLLGLAAELATMELDAPFVSVNCQGILAEPVSFHQQANEVGQQGVRSPQKEWCLWILVWKWGELNNKLSICWLPLAVAFGLLSGCRT